MENARKHTIEEQHPVVSVKNGRTSPTSHHIIFSSSANISSPGLEKAKTPNGQKITKYIYRRATLFSLKYCLIFLLTNTEVWQFQLLHVLHLGCFPLLAERRRAADPLPRRLHLGARAGRRLPVSRRAQENGWNGLCVLRIFLGSWVGEKKFWIFGFFFGWDD